MRPPAASTAPDLVSCSITVSGSMGSPDMNRSMTARADQAVALAVEVVLGHHGRGLGHVGPGVHQARRAASPRPRGSAAVGCARPRGRGPARREGRRRRGCSVEQRADDRLDLGHEARRRARPARCSVPTARMGGSTVMWRRSTRTWRASKIASATSAEVIEPNRRPSPPALALSVRIVRPSRSASSSRLLLAPATSAARRCSSRRWTSAMRAGVASSASPRGRR